MVKTECMQLQAHVYSLTSFPVHSIAIDEKLGVGGGGGYMLCVHLKSIHLTGGWNHTLDADNQNRMWQAGHKTIKMENSRLIYVTSFMK